MSESSDKPVSVVEAARIIYATKTPTDQQIHRVYERLKSGLLPVRGGGRTLLEWTTTESGLAEFLATQSLQRQRCSTSAAARSGTNPARSAATKSSQRQARALRSAYRGIWKEYFLAVMLRRRAGRHSRSFDRAVLAGQALTLVSLVAVMAGGVHFVVDRAAPEHAAIERWIDEHTDRHKITRWHPAEPANESADSGDGRGSHASKATIVRVEYSYSLHSNRTIHTDRKFRVVGDAVEEAPLDNQ